MQTKGNIFLTSEIIAFALMEIDALESFLSLFANSSFVAKEALVSLTIIRSGLFLLKKT